MSPEKGLGSLTRVDSREEKNVPGGRIRLKLTHVNVNCKEEDTGYTPLIIAVLKGKQLVPEV